MLECVTTTRAAAVVVVLASFGLGCTRAIPEFTNEFGIQTEETSTSTSTGSDETGPGIPDMFVDSTCDQSTGDPCLSADMQKCVPGEFGGYECVEVLGSQIPGEACENDPVTNTDDCGADSYCYAGLCRSFCSQGAGCAGQAACWTDSWLCIDGCDPLAQDCPGGALACMWTKDEALGFQCGEANGLGEGQACYGSVVDHACGPGLGCVPELQYIGGCGALLGGGCCSPYCDYDEGNVDCIGDAGDTCIWGAIESVPNLGVCGGVGFSTGDLAIVEVYADPPGLPIYEAPFEYVEILNISAQEIELGLLSIDDYVGGGSDKILDRFSVSGGNGGCQGGTSACLGPGRRALFVGLTYMGETGEALVLRANNMQIFGTILQPWGRIELFDELGGVVISTYRQWPDPTEPPLPMDELPMHRLDVAGPDTQSNWASQAPSPGF